MRQTEEMIDKKIDRGGERKKDTEVRIYKNRQIEERRDKMRWKTEGKDRKGER